MAVDDKSALGYVGPKEERGSRERARLLKQFEAQDKLEVDGAVRTLVRNREGRAYIWWLLSVTRIGQQPFSTDPHITAFRCGEMNVGNQILSHLMEVAPAAYLQMMQEAEDGRRARDAQLERAETSSDAGEQWDDPAGGASRSGYDTARPDDGAFEGE